MKTKARATIEDLYAIDGKAELVNGEIVLMPPTGYSPARAGLRIAASLMRYEEETGTGHALPDNAGFVVNTPRQRSFSADAAFYLGQIPQGVDMRFIEGAPIFAAEVRSATDYGPAAEKRLEAKRADYFASGTQIVWDVDLRAIEVVKAYRADDPGNPTVYRRGEVAEAEPALPGWKMPVDDLFK